MARKVFSPRVVVITVGLFLAVSLVALRVGQAQGGGVAIDADDIGGVVTGPKGPEAGVWVIAETKDLQTKHAKVVVTDDQGRYVVPDLPRGRYDVWVRGYGLVDSPKVTAEPGRALNLTAVVAPNAKAAAQYYPAQYWYSMMQVPAPSQFPGTGPQGNGISPNIRSQGEWIRNIVSTDGCTGCHTLGNKATREIPAALGSFESAHEAWERRVQSGQAGGQMDSRFSQVGRGPALAMYADWTNRIASGEVPATAPARPQGVERNVVISLWDWADPHVYLHDSIASDKRNPRVNPNGPIYGATEASSDYMPVLDPDDHLALQAPLRVRDPLTPSSASTPPMQPSAYWGEEVIWNSQSNAHSFAMDAQSRVWIAAKVRPDETPAFCQAGSSHPSAAAFPISNSGRQVQMFDPKTKEVTTVNTCFGTHHLNFDYQDKLWFCGGGPVVGWFDTKVFDATKDEQKAQGWTVLVVDSNGNGKRDAYVEPDQPLDAAKDKRINAPFYGVAPSPVDGSIWGSTLGMPGGLVRLVPGDNPPSTALAELYLVPFNDPKTPAKGFAPRGMDVDAKGVVWTTLSSGHLASFDRTLCKGPLNGPAAATGTHCTEGWKLYPYPGPNFKGAVDSASAESAYYNFVDRFNMLGVGDNVPLATGNESEALLALIDGQFRTFRVPYPLGGFYGKGLDGRIDDPNGGWKGKGIWTTSGTRAPFHAEGGKGAVAQVFKFQVRPNPLAK
jgi:hypothetical protein